VAALRTIAAAARATLGRDAIVWTRSSSVAALLAPVSDAAGERRAIASRLQRELDVRVRDVTVSIGVGRRADDYRGLARSFTEASRAVDVGRWAKGRHVTEVFDELGLERLLASCPERELHGFVRDTIGPLVDHDRERGAGLVETLVAWLDTRNMAEAARRVHVHYNTHKNRLDRIEAILGPVLGDPELALACQVALHVARQHDLL
jgi:purine catabolism regulator